ncbi:MAG TPA: plasmid stabilization protein [Geobacter sp.]|nr:plasmid stabilization protein [Geobacter sp.]
MCAPLRSSGLKKLIFHPDAEAETAKAADFYNGQQKNLGKRFVSAVEEGAARVRVDPLIYPIVEGDVRRCLIRTFPFSILFRLKRNRVVIVAVMHLHRKPGYWKDRD